MNDQVFKQSIVSTIIPNNYINYQNLVQLNIQNTGLDFHNMLPERFVRDLGHCEQSSCNVLSHFGLPHSNKLTGSNVRRKSLGKGLQK